jgi:Family of unknown function (DUF6069)
MAAITSAPATRQRVALRRLWWIAPLTIVLAALANLMISFLGVSFFGVPSTFPLLQPGPVIASTVVFLLLATVAFIVIGRFSRHPIRVYRLVALVAVVLSFLNPIAALAGWFPAPGMNLNIFWTMIAMHIISAIITVGLFTTTVGTRNET